MIEAKFTTYKTDMNDPSSKKMVVAVHGIQDLRGHVDYEGTTLKIKHVDGRTYPVTLGKKVADFRKPGKSQDVLFWIRGQEGSCGCKDLPPQPGSDKCFFCTREDPFLFNSIKLTPISDEESSFVF